MEPGKTVQVVNEHSQAEDRGYEGAFGRLDGPTKEETGLITEGLMRGTFFDETAIGGDLDASSASISTLLLFVDLLFSSVEEAWLKDKLAKAKIKETFILPIQNAEGYPWYLNPCGTLANLRFTKSIGKIQIVFISKWPSLLQHSILILKCNFTNDI